VVAGGADRASAAAAERRVRLAGGASAASI
jgi:hypothetical protein